MAGKTLPPIEYLRQIIDYNPDTGEMVWAERGPDTFGSDCNIKNAELAKSWNTRRVGVRVGSDNGGGYLKTTVRMGRTKSKVFVHRLAWAISYGEWPQVIDHMNGNRKDNRLCNLRSVSASINGRNAKRRADNTSGANGVHYHKARRKWIAYFDADGSRTYLGYFHTKDDALAARKRADAGNGFTARHGGA